MEEIIKTITLYSAQIIELLGASIIVYASSVAFLHYLKNVFQRKYTGVPNLEIRLTLGRSLAIALELLLGADILKTAIAPTWNEIGQLAAIATLRTALNYFLERELRQTKPKEG